MERSPGRNIIEIADLWRSYRRGSETIHACAGINLEVRAAEMVAIVGRSGSGKTTLLNLIGCLDTATRGRICLSGRDVTHLSESALVRFRRDKIGFIFQLFYLIPTLTVGENVELPLIFARRRSRARVDEVLEKTGISELRDFYPNELDGGSMQKVAISRALVNNPEILLADEPTGRLEHRAKDSILELFKRLSADGLAVVLATHDLALAGRCRRMVRLSDGAVVEVRNKEES